jgi:hypothetical protein
VAKRPLTEFTGLTGKQQAKGKTGAVSILLILSKLSALRGDMLSEFSTFLAVNPNGFSAQVFLFNGLFAII